MKSQPGTYGRAGKRLYGADDWRLFQIIRKQTTAGKTFDEIRATLDEDFTRTSHWKNSWWTRTPKPPPAGRSHARTRPFGRFVDLLRATKPPKERCQPSAKNGTTCARKTAELEAAIVDAERRAAKEAELEVLRRLLDATPPQQRQTWLQRLFGSSSGTAENGRLEWPRSRESGFPHAGIHLR